jgi:glycosyltransferase involved in cell wall biosynthesis
MDAALSFGHLKGQRISVVVPVFNEARHIEDNLRLLISEIEPYFDSYEIIAVNDGSADETEQKLRSFRHPRFRAVSFQRNMGKGHAVRQGFREATGDYVLFIDGGMELHPKEIKTFLGLMTLYDADVVVGSKRHPQSRVTYPAVRRALSFTYQLLVRQLFDLDVTDTQVGIKLFRREVIDAIADDLTIDRYGFDLEILALARARGFTHFLEAPIRLDYFGGNPRSFARELLHVGQVGLTLMADTLRLHRRLRRLGPRSTP